MALTCSLFCQHSLAATCEHIIQNEWDTGFVGSIKITNTSTTTIPGWNVSWEYENGSKITNSWNAVFSGDNPYFAENQIWSRDIAPGQTAEFGFQGTKAVANANMMNPVVTGAVCENDSIPNTEPSASFLLSNISGTVPFVINVDASASTDADGDALSYAWAFGDGSTSSGVTSSHTYNTAGSYDITLTVTDSKGASSSISKMVIVEPEVPVLNAEFTSTSNGLVTNFNGRDTLDGAEFSWDFGDGNTGDGQNIEHTYAAAGEYSVTLTVSLNGEVETENKIISVRETSAQILFEEGFETSIVDQQPNDWENFIGWVHNNNNTKGGNVFALVDDAISYSGNKSVHFKGGPAPAQIIRQLPDGVNTLYIKAMVYMSKKLGNEAGDNHEHILGIKADASANNEIRFGQIKGHLGTNEVPTDDISPTMSQWFSGPEMLPNTWYCVELAMLGNLPYHQLHARVDGELVHSITSASDWNNGGVGGKADWLADKFNYVMFGWHSFSGNNADVWMDDIVVSTGPVGCN